MNSIKTVEVWVSPPPTGILTTQTALTDCKKILPRGLCIFSNFWVPNITSPKYFTHALAFCYAMPLWRNVIPVAEKLDFLHQPPSYTPASKHSMRDISIGSNFLLNKCARLRGTTWFDCEIISLAENIKTVVQLLINSPCVLEIVTTCIS